MRSNGLKGQQANSPGQRPGYKKVGKDGLKGQQANSPGQRPGYKEVGKDGLKGQKHTCTLVAFAPLGRWLRTTYTPGRCPALWAFWPFRPSLLVLDRRPCQPFFTIERGKYAFLY